MTLGGTAPGAPPPRRRRRLPPWRTLRGRLALGALAGLFAAALVFGVVSSSLVRTESSRQGRDEFDQLTVRLARLISVRLDRQALNGSCDSFRKADIEAYLGRGARLYVLDGFNTFCVGSVLRYGDIAVATPPQLDKGEIQRKGYERLDEAFAAAGADRVATAAMVTLAGRPWTYIVLSKPRADVATQWKDVAPSLIMAALIGFVPALLLTLLLTARVTRPLEDMEAAADRVAGGDLSATVPPAGTAELDHLAAAFNGMVTRLREREDSTREFLMKVTHDLRTPLTAIRGHAAALADGIVPEQQVPRSLAAIEGEAGRLEAMVADLLDLARIDARRFRMDHVPVDPEEVLQQAFDALAPDAARRDIRYTRRIAPLPVVVTDPSRLRQIVANLLDNALRWVPEGGTVTMEAEPAANGGLRVRVGDSGPGVAPPLREEIFQPFRSHETPDGRTGVGLGLAICRQLARELGGDVSVDDAPEGGARFELRLPAAPPGLTAPNGTVSRPAATMGNS
ncbi:MAG: HAMP domain-containing sensor histidine kinase [Thermoleophilia bacterium]